MQISLQIKKNREHVDLILTCHLCTHQSDDLFTQEYKRSLCLKGGPTGKGSLYKVYHDAE